MSTTLGKKENTKTSAGFLERLFKTKSSPAHDSNKSRRSTLQDKTSQRPYGQPKDRSSTPDPHDTAAVDREDKASASKSSASCHNRRQTSVSTGQVRGSSASSSSLTADIGGSPPPVLEYPATPETMLARHGARPFLDADELAVLEELGAFECLVGGAEVIRAVAQHARYFGVDPAQLWDEFFRFEDKDYDDVVDVDVWRQFTDRKYPC